MKKGIVYLVGAGPGDPGLITCKGLECLAKAAVVVYDYLADERLLASAPPEAEKIYVGKKASEHTLEQSAINRLLVDKAEEGKVVVRLKGGDPFVLGRGGEEADELAKNKIPFEVVPGVTSAIAVPAYAGIPVTHRKVASSFAVITGHEDPTKPDSAINWEKLATGVDTLVFLMGMNNLPEIIKKLAQYGRPLDTPVAVIKDGTRPSQQTVTGNIKNIAGKVKKAKLSPPALIVVGEVVRLRDKLRWFDNRPLTGKRILVTRSRQQASALSKLLSERGADPVELPVIDIRPVTDTTGLDRAIKNPSQFQWVIFTSVNGVEAFFERLHIFKLDARALHNLKIAAIGPATVEALEHKGITPDFCPEVYTGAGLVIGLSKYKITGQKFLLPRTDIADKELSDGIKQLGGIVHEITVYQTVSSVSPSKAREILADGKIDVVTFASSSTVTNLMTALKKESISLNGVIIACIGPKTADTAAKSRLKVDIVATESTIPGLVAAIEECYSKHKN